MNHHEETTSLCIGRSSYDGNRRSNRIFAADIPQTPTPQSSSESTIAPYADVIVYKYRLYNGKQQYRRWNETRGYWVDPYWIDTPG